MEKCCKYCGIKFIPDTNRQTYCTKRCTMDAKNKRVLEKINQTTASKSAYNLKARIYYRKNRNTILEKRRQTNKIV